MSLIISFVGLKTNERNKDIYQKQLEILENDREPYFTLEWIEANDEINDMECEAIFKIKNMGGCLEFGSVDIIDIYDIYLFGKTARLKVGYFGPSSYVYNKDEKNFVISYSTKYAYVGEIQKKLKDVYAFSYVTLAF